MPVVPPWLSVQSVKVERFLATHQILWLPRVCRLLDVPLSQSDYLVNRRLDFLPETGLKFWSPEQLDELGFVP